MQLPTHLRQKSPTRIQTSACEKDQPYQPRVALGFISPRDNVGLVEIFNLRLIFLQELRRGRCQPHWRSSCYRPEQLATSIKWAAPSCCKQHRVSRDLSHLTSEILLKNLSPRLRENSVAVLGGLKRQLSQVDSRESAWQFPKLWAGYAATGAGSVRIAGEQPETMAQQLSLPLETFQRKFTRTHNGLNLLPLEWVLGNKRHPLRIFADLAGFPRAQARALSGQQLLRGRSTASRFDFGIGSSRRGSFQIVGSASCPL